MIKDDVKIVIWVTSVRHLFSISKYIALYIFFFVIFNYFYLFIFLSDKSGLQFVDIRQLHIYLWWPLSLCSLRFCQCKLCYFFLLYYSILLFLFLLHLLIALDPYILLCYCCCACLHFSLAPTLFILETAAT